MALLPPQTTQRTLCELPHYPWPKWSAGQAFLSSGSCFADHIGNRLLAASCLGQVNPLGVMFNPISVARSLTHTADELMANIVLGQSGWVSYHAHSKFANPSQAELAKTLAHITNKRDALLQTDPIIVLTLGTAYVWELLEGGSIVANCHKQPNQHFNRRLLTTDEIVEAIKTVGLKLPNCRFILTVSPIRHTRETLVGNGVSKATLRLASHLLTTHCPDQFYYFPAYELVQDDLRDYRYYEADMIHPTVQAIDYVWQALLTTVADDSLISAIKTADAARKRLAHRPISS